jgi:hypothetical protein
MAPQIQRPNLALQNQQQNMALQTPQQNTPNMFPQLMARGSTPEPPPQTDLVLRPAHMANPIAEPQHQNPQEAEPVILQNLDGSVWQVTQHRPGTDESAWFITYDQIR